ncbi:hypothetical protein VYU27_004784 [Nannochloropsis oceanica]
MGRWISYAAGFDLDQHSQPPALTMFTPPTPAVNVLPWHFRTLHTSSSTMLSSQRRSGGALYPRTIRRWPMSLLGLLLMLAGAGCCIQAFILPLPRRPKVGLLQLHRQHPCRQRGALFASTTQEPGSDAPADSISPTPSTLASNAVTPSGKGFGTAPPPVARAKTGTVNKRLMNVIDAELKVVRDNQPEEATPLSEDDTDLNGINPIQPLGAAVFAAFISFLFWRITFGLANTLNNVHLDTDFYPAKRVFGIASTAFVGITALGAGVIGVTAIGLLGLTVRVMYGIITGELDMNKKKYVPPVNTSSVPLDSNGLPKITGAWYDIKAPVKAPAEETKE